MISGVLPVDKPAGWTSHDVVARLRRVVGQRQIGHAGTLDPLATGVLVLVLGDATRLSSYLMEGTKVYCAAVVLGATTATDDAEAPLQCRADASHIERQQIESCLATFHGEIDQLPPAYAAVRHEGEKLYALARKGVSVEARPRRVTVHKIEILSWDAPHLRLRVCCGPGTYVRSLARDLGAALNVGGYLHALRRVASGSITIRDCPPLSDLADRSTITERLLPPDIAVLHWPALVLSPQEASDIRKGRAIPVGTAAEGNVRLYDAEGAFLALGRLTAATVHPFRVFGGR